MAKAERYTLKTFFSPALVRRLGADLARAHPSFNRPAFVRDACRGLPALELLDRGKHIAVALEKHLPEEYRRAVEVLLRSLGPELPTDELIGVGMALFFYLPHMVFVSTHPKRVIELLELLKDDPATVVRRSVANSLNDLGKGHRELLTQTCAAWLEGGSCWRRATA